MPEEIRLSKVEIRSLKSQLIELETLQAMLKQYGSISHNVVGAVTETACVVKEIMMTSNSEIERCLDQLSSYVDREESRIASEAKLKELEELYPILSTEVDK